MPASRDVRPADGLLRRGKMAVERRPHVIATYDNEASLVARSHHAKTARLEVEVGWLGNPRQRMHHHHDWTLETLPALRRVYGYLGQFLVETERHRGVHDAVRRAEAYVGRLNGCFFSVNALLRTSGKQPPSYVHSQVRDLQVLFGVWRTQIEGDSFEEIG